MLGELVGYKCIVPSMEQPSSAHFIRPLAFQQPTPFKPDIIVYNTTTPSVALLELTHL